MYSPLKRLAVAGTAIVSAIAVTGSMAMAAPGQMYQANLTSLNGSGTSGTATVQEIDDNTVKVSLTTTGASANLPHAQHIHVGGNNTCPAPSADKDNDKLISTAEGQPAYGEVKISLTNTGRTGATSALAVDRFPTADAKGTVTYERTFDLPSGTTMSDVTNGVVVQHGISKLFGDKAKYDGDKKSSLDEKLPLEATIPAACGKLTAAPVGGVDTGTGSTAGTENTQYALFGAVALMLGAALVASRSLAHRSSK